MIDNESLIPQSRVEIAFRIAAIDDLIGTQLNEILHHLEFKELEATWRGLHYLISESQPGQRVKIKILNVKKRDLLKDFDRAIEFDQSEIFKKVYDEVYYTVGESPFGILIGAYEFDEYPLDVKLLQNLSMVAGMSHTPFISGASPKMFPVGVSDHNTFFGIFKNFRDLSNTLAGYHTGWSSFRESFDSRYVGLCLPHILLRDSHNFQTGANKAFNFQESIEPENFLWGNAAFAFGACVMRAFNEKSWLGIMNGIDSDGRVEGLYSHYLFSTDLSDYQISLDEIIKPEHDAALSKLGLIPLIEYSHMDSPAFFSNQSANKPKIYDTDQATSIARSFTQLSNIFAVSRFAHYLMVIARDRSQPFSDREECRRELNKWISRYVLIDDNNDKEWQAKYPLREALIDVQQVPNKPDKFRAIVFLQPIYQLETLPFAMRVIVDLP